ncbi:hypothetical protein D3C77_681540 [compost metagenome]
MDRAHADFMAAGKAQTETYTVFKLERRPKLIVFNFGAGKCRHADTGFDIWFYRLSSKLVDEYRSEGKTVVTCRIITVPIRVTRVPITRKPANASLPPAGIPV